MLRQVDAILFDVNGTLRGTVRAGEDRRLQKIQQMLDLLGTDRSPAAFGALLEQRMQGYRDWARTTTSEASEVELWTRWLLPDCPAPRIGEAAPQLHHLWREATGIRTIFPEARDVLLELFHRGYRLGIVSNTMGARELRSALRDLGIAGVFETIVLSSEVGVRKPNPAILLEAARRLSLEPVLCAYVGNRADRDLAAAHGAGFAKTVLLRGPQMGSGGEPSLLPGDDIVDGLRALLPIFPPKAATQGSPLYNASFSTMWARRNLPDLGAFFEASRRLGFAGLELNHQIDSSMLEGLDLSRYPIGSIHEPCPADVSTEQLKERDWLISSPDEQCRQHGVEAIKHSIDLAARLHVPVIVVHCGMMSTDLAREQKLKALLKDGRRATSDYRTIQEDLIRARRELAGVHLQAVRRSLPELLEYAGQFGIRLGLENRYHYFDIPSLDEMEQLLGMADAARLGFVYDVGHAQALDRLGFHPHEQWLRRYSTRIIETHLHDVQGTSDHLAPGLGEIDFRMVASYLPADAIRTLELQGTNTPDQVKAGLLHLERHGCISAI